MDDGWISGFGVVFGGDWADIPLNRWTVRFTWILGKVEFFNLVGGEPLPIST